MILWPSGDSHRVIGTYTGKILVGFGIVMLVPFVTAFVTAEWDAAFDFAIGVALCFVVGLGAQVVFRTERDLSWGEGLVTSAGSWIWASLLAAVPYWLSGHYGSFLDCVFDTVSGTTTTGLFLLQDLDHVSIALNMWRHVLTYLGGQGIVVIALTFFVKGTAGAYKMYVGEGKDERLMPNVMQTARAIWFISVVYLVVGTGVLGLVNLFLGFSPAHAFLHALWIFMGSWSTGGFAPLSYNAYYYHSAVAEIVQIVIMVAGSMNFALHWSVWTGKRREIVRNIETQSFAITSTVLVFITLVVLARAGVYPNAVALARKVLFLVLSGHTTTGSSTIYARAFVTQWGPTAMTAVTVAMMIGASASSTAGGIKGFRVGIVARVVAEQVRASVLPERAVVRTRYHHIKDSFLDDAVVRSALTITVLFLVGYLVSMLLGMACGYPVDQALFEGVSALSNSGLSCGITAPSMPGVLKVAYIVFMWLGRMEFLSAFAVIARLIAVFRGR